MDICPRCHTRNYVFGICNHCGYPGPDKRRAIGGGGDSRDRPEDNPPPPEPPSSVGQYVAAAFVLLLMVGYCSSTTRTPSAIPDPVAAATPTGLPSASATIAEIAEPVIAEPAPEEPSPAPDAATTGDAVAVSDEPPASSEPPMAAPPAPVRPVRNPAISGTPAPFTQGSWYAPDQIVEISTGREREPVLIRIRDHRPVRFTRVAYTHALGRVILYVRGRGAWDLGVQIPVRAGELLDRSDRIMFVRERPEGDLEVTVIPLIPI